MLGLLLNRKQDSLPITRHRKSRVCKLNVETVGNRETRISAVRVSNDELMRARVRKGNSYNSTLIDPHTVEVALDGPGLMRIPTKHMATFILDDNHCASSVHHRTATRVRVAFIHTKSGIPSPIRLAGTGKSKNSRRARPTNRAVPISPTKPRAAILGEVRYD